MNTMTLSELAAVIDTYEGMLAMCNNGDGADHLFLALDRAYAAYNAALIAMGD